MFSMLSGFPHGTFGPKTLHTHTQSDFQNQDNLISWTSGKQITGKQCQHKDMRRNR